MQSERRSEMQLIPLLLLPPRRSQTLCNHFHLQAQFDAALIAQLDRHTASLKIMTSL